MSICIQEHQRFFSDSSGVVDAVTVPAEAYEFLKLAAVGQVTELRDVFSIVGWQGRECLKAEKYVGLVACPDGTEIEILPKTHPDQTSIDSRKLLLKMLRAVEGLPDRREAEGSVSTADWPIFEYIVRCFLDEAFAVVHRGLRRDYVRVRAAQRAIRGKLDMAREARKLPSQRHEVYVEFSGFSDDRPENRLIRTALNMLSTQVRSPSNSRRLKELGAQFTHVPLSDDWRADYRRWSNDRDVAHYRRVRPYVHMILSRRTPLLYAGPYRATSFLFSMQTLFEAYLATLLRRQAVDFFQVSKPSRLKHLARHRDQGIFLLRPDYFLMKGDQIHAVLDAKWKLLDESASSGWEKYRISQADMYQLFAYAHKYLPDGGTLFLIYPKHEDLTGSLTKFYLSDQHRLWVVAADLDRDVIEFPAGMLEAVARAREDGVMSHDHATPETAPGTARQSP